MRPRPARRVAAIVLTLQAVAILVLAAWEVLALLVGDVESVASSVALIVLTMIGAVAVAAFAAATGRGVSWGRSGGIVTQLLVLAVALGAATGAYAHPVVGAVLAAAGLAGMIPLILDARRTGAERRRDGRDDDGRDTGRDDTGR